MRSKRLATILLALLLLSLHPTAAPAAASAATASALFTLDSTTYELNGERRTMDAAPTLIDGRTLVPVRYLAYALGLTDDGIVWDGATRTVTLSNGRTTLRLWAGSRTLSLNGRAAAMDAAPVNIPPGRLALPARAVAEAFGYRVEWDASTRTIRVLAGAAAPAEAPGAGTSALPETDPATLPDDGSAPVWPKFSAPGAPLLGASALTLQWPAASDDRGIDAYTIEQDGQRVATLPGVTTQYQVTGLDPGRAYTFAIAATDFAGRRSSPLNFTARTAPAVASPLQVEQIAVSGREVAVTYSAPLKRFAPLGSAGFAVTRNGWPVGISSASIAPDGRTVHLVLTDSTGGKNVFPGPADLVTVSYQPGADPVQDQAGHLADPLPATPAAYKSTSVRAISARTDPYGAIWVLFSAPLNPFLSADPTDFTINVNGVNMPAENWPDPWGPELHLPASGISAGDQVSISYTPSANPVVDAQYNAALPFTNLPVTNNATQPQPDWPVAGDGLTQGAPVRCQRTDAAAAPPTAGPGWQLKRLSPTDCLTDLTATVTPDGELSLSGTVALQAHWSALAVQVNHFSQLPFSNVGRFHWDEDLIPVTAGRFQVTLPLSGPALRTVKLLGVGPGYWNRTELASAEVDVTASQLVEPVPVMDPRLTLLAPRATNLSVTDGQVRLAGTLSGDLADVKQLHISLSQYTKGPVVDWPTPNVPVTAGRFDAAIPLPGGPGRYLVIVETVGENGRSSARLFNVMVRGE